ncbi:MAG: hypothetical protein ACKOA4_00485 [Haliscomenobacter sp.]
MKPLGYLLMQGSVILFIASSTADILLTFVFGGILPSHLAYLELHAHIAVTPQIETLNLAMVRTIGALFLAIGLAGQVILYELVRTGHKRGPLYLVSILSVGVIMYTLLMSEIQTPHYFAPLLSLALLLLGSALWRNTKSMG